MACQLSAKFGYLFGAEVRTRIKGGADEVARLVDMQLYPNRALQLPHPLGQDDDRDGQGDDGERDDDPGEVEVRHGDGVGRWTHHALIPARSAANHATRPASAVQRA